MNKGDAAILRVVGEFRQPIHATRLVKLVYLADYVYFQHFGRTITGLDYVWDRYGPNAVSHAVVREAEKLAAQGSLRITHQDTIYGTTSTRFALSPGTTVPALRPEEELVVRDVLARYGALPLRALVAATKKTRPFECALPYQLLRMEQAAPAGGTSPGDWEAHRSELEELGSMSLEDVGSRYGLS